MTKEIKMPTLPDGQPAITRHNNNHNPKHQENWIPLQKKLDEIMANLKPEKKAEQECSGLVFTLQVALVPHRRTMRKAIIIRLFQYGALSLDQVTYLFSIFDLKEV